MFVRIMKASKKSAWYANMVGKVLELSDTKPHAYVLEGDIRIVDEDDFTVIPPKIVETGWQLFRNTVNGRICKASKVTGVVPLGNGYNRLLPSHRIVDGEVEVGEYIIDSPTLVVRSRVAFDSQHVEIKHQLKDHQLLAISSDGAMSCWRADDGAIVLFDGIAVQSKGYPYATLKGFDNTTYLGLGSYPYIFKET